MSEEKKKILFSAYSLKIGGIETALITLVNKLAESYDITLVLEKKEGIFLNEINDNVNIIEYTPYNYKIKLLSKIKNVFKRMRFIFKYKNKFNISISFATYSLPGSFVARTASKNSVLWVHNDYMLTCNNSKSEYIKFFKSIHAKKFKKIVFVSNSMRNTFEEVLGNDYKNERLTIYNLINDEFILNKSKEMINDIEKSNTTTFLYVGRLSETNKKISRLIKACKILKDNNYKFRTIIVGDGKDREKYQSMVKDLELNSEIIFLGEKKNPYPYFKLSDCLVLTSEHEGFALVNIEAMILELPIITTCIADSKEMIDKKYGYVTEKNEEAIAECMKRIIDEGYNTKYQFDVKKYNSEIINKIKKIIEGEQ